MERGRKKSWAWVLLLVVVLAGFGVYFWQSGVMKQRRERELLAEKMAVVAPAFDKIGDFLADDGDFDAEKVDDFAKNVEECDEALKDLGDLEAYNDNEEMRAKYDAMVAGVKELRDTAEIAKTFKELREKVISDDTLAKMKDSGSQFLKKFGEDFSEYREKVSDFVKKYTQKDGVDKKELQEEYGNLMNDGDALEAKYKSDAGFSKMSAEKARELKANAESLKAWAEEQ